MAEEKEPKPKKQYEIKVIIWDDGELDSELTEYRQNKSGRGAPGKWRLTATDFVRRMEETLGEPEHILNDIHNIIGGANVDSQEVRKLVAEEIKDGKQVVEQVKETEEAPKNKKSKKAKGNEETAGDDPDVKDMDFGGFDTDKDK